MTIRRTAPCTSVALLAALLALSPSSWAREFTARQLVDHLYVVNGQLPIQTLIVEMDVSKLLSKENGGTGNLERSSKDKICFKKPSKIHIDSILIDPGGPMDGKQVSIVRDGVNMWMFISMGQYPVKKGADQPEPTSWLPFNVQTYPVDSQKEYTLVGKDQVAGVSADVVRIVDPASPKAVVTVWIDRTRWVPLRKEIVRPSTKPGEANAGKRILYKDIRKLSDGRYFPFLIEVYEGDVLVGAGSYKAVSINEKLPDTLFEPLNKFLK